MIMKAQPILDFS